MQGGETEKRRHAKIPLRYILEEATPREGVNWIVPHSRFEINWDLFVPFYHRRTNSTAKQSNIVNRFTRPNNNYHRDFSSTMNEGYHAVYFKDELVFDPQKEFNKPSLDEFLRLLKKKENEIPVMSLANKLTENHGAFDQRDMMTLLISEVIGKKNNTHISNQEVINFLSRFGPSQETVYKMKDFLESGARDWYHGAISREIAENRLRTCLQTKDSAYLVRAKSYPNKNVVFVFSYGFSNFDSPKIYHCEIFSKHNKLVTTCRNERNELIETVISSAVGLLDFLNPAPSFPLPSPDFQFSRREEILDFSIPERYNVPYTSIINL